MPGYKILVDSSVWIEYFKKGRPSNLDFIIEEGLAVTNQVILTELIPKLHHQNHGEIIDSLNMLDLLPMRIDWDVIRNYQLLNIKNGVNKVGIPDLIILQQVIEQRVVLYSFDKHFRLMKAYLNFDLLDQ